MKKYYDNAKDNAAFERCVDVMAGMIVKYGPGILEKHKEKESGVQSDDFKNGDGNLRAA